MHDSKRERQTAEGVNTISMLVTLKQETIQIQDWIQCNRYACTCADRSWAEMRKS